MPFADRMASGRAFSIGAALAIALSAPTHATTLDEAIASAMRYAPALAAADAGVRAADGTLTEARAQRLPIASARASIAAGRIDPGGFFGLQAANITPRSADVSVEQPLFSGGRVKAGIDAARAGGRAARAQQASARAELAAAVAAAYSGVIVATIDLDRYRELEAEMAEIERQAGLKFKSGDTPRTDLAQARARHAGAVAGLAQAEGDLATARAHYRALVGAEPDRLMPLPPAPVTPPSLDAALEIALRANPALAEAQAAADRAAAMARASRADRLPTVSAFAEAASVRDQFFPGYQGDSVAAGIRARWVFFDAGRTTGRIDQAVAKRDAADAGLRAARDAVIENVTAAFQRLRTARQVESAATLQSVAATDALRNVKLEAKVGARPQLAILDAERDALAADLQAASARGEVVTAAFQLRGLLGEY